VAGDPEAVGRILREGCKRVIWISLKRVQERSREEKHGAEDSANSTNLIRLTIRHFGSRGLAERRRELFFLAL
jgi:hypothetical protein